MTLRCSGANEGYIGTRLGRRLLNPKGSFGPTLPNQFRPEKRQIFAEESLGPFMALPASTPGVIFGHSELMNFSLTSAQCPPSGRTRFRLGAARHCCAAAMAERPVATEVQRFDVLTICDHVKINIVTQAGRGVDKRSAQDIPDCTKFNFQLSSWSCFKRAWDRKVVWD